MGTDTYAVLSRRRLPRIQNPHPNPEQRSQGPQAHTHPSFTQMFPVHTRARFPGREFTSLEGAPRTPRCFA